MAESKTSFDVALEKSLEKNPQKSTKKNLQFRSFWQGNLTNELVAINRRTKHKVIAKEDDQGQLYLFTPDELDILVSIKQGDKYSMSLSASKLLDVIVIILEEDYHLPHRKGNCFIPKEELLKYIDFDLSVSKYMEYLGLRGRRKDAIYQLRRDLNVLKNMEAEKDFRWYEGKRRIMKHFKMQGPFELIPGDKERIIDFASIRLSLSFLEYIANYSYFMWYPTKILLSEKNSNVYYVGRKLAEQYNMNKGKTNANSIRIENILIHTPELPTLKMEHEGERGYRRRCVEPLEKALDRLVELGILKKWYFKNEETGIDYTKKAPHQLSDLATSYADWRKVTAYFEFNDYPQKAVTVKERKGQKKEAVDSKSDDKDGKKVE